MNKKYLFLALILLVGIISISAVSAADDLASDISVADDDQGIILEESIPQNLLTNDENQDVLTNDENEEPVLASKNDEPIVSSSGNAKVKENATAKKKVLKIRSLSKPYPKAARIRLPLRKSKRL